MLPCCTQFRSSELGLRMIEDSFSTFRCDSITAACNPYSLVQPANMRKKIIYMNQENSETRDIKKLSAVADLIKYFFN